MTNIEPIKYDRFLSQFPTKTFRQGRILIAPNDEPECIFYIVSGRVRKYEVTRYGEKAVMNTFTESALFPLPWVLNNTPNLYHFEALTPLTVRCIPTDQMSEFLQHNTEFAYSLLKSVYAGLEVTQRRIVYLMRGSIRSRVLFELVIECRRSGQPQEDGSVSITISEAELADRAGLSRETVSRELAKLLKISDVGVRQGRSIMIRSLSALESMLQKNT